MNFKQFNNRGSVDVGAWIVGMVGFSTVFMVWIFVAPIVTDLIDVGLGMGFGGKPDWLLTFIDMLWNNAMILNALVWLAYILLSSVREEVEYRVI